jgi:hypothetical protein
MDLDSTLDAIDAATAPVCGWCSATIGPDTPSDLYCSQEHQELWLSRNAEPLVDYREPVDLAAHVDNQWEGSSPQTAPRPVGLSAGGLMMALYGNCWYEVTPAGLRLMPTTETTVTFDTTEARFEPRYPVREIQWTQYGRVASWTVFDEAHWARSQDGPWGSGEWSDDGPLSHFTIHEDGRIESNVDSRQRALDARRNRNTGPQQSRRAPRRIDPRRSR